MQGATLDYTYRIEQIGGKKMRLLAEKLESLKERMHRAEDKLTGSNTQKTRAHVQGKHQSSNESHSSTGSWGMLSDDESDSPLKL